jgi:hypothetical protein
MLAPIAAVAGLVVGAAAGPLGGRRLARFCPNCGRGCLVCQEVNSAR